MTYIPNGPMEIALVEAGVQTSKSGTENYEQNHFGRFRRTSCWRNYCLLRYEWQEQKTNTRYRK